MATQSAFVWDETFSAENDLSAKQFYAVELSAQSQVDVCDGASDRVMGVLQNKPKAGEMAIVRIMGKTKWVSDGTQGAGIAVGGTVGTHSNGKCIVKSADADLQAGIANEASTTDGKIIEVFLTYGCQRAS
jgi:hypothetical protein